MHKSAIDMQYAIAKNTRKVLVEGKDKDSSGGAPKHADLSPQVPLQECALHFLLKAGCIDKLL